MAIDFAAARGWQPMAAAMALRPEAQALADVRPLLARIVEALGSNAAGRVLDANRSQVSRWRSGKEGISAEMAGRIVDLHDVLTRAVRLYPPPVAALWLVGSEPLLGGARPIDVLALRGAAPVIAALEGIAAGVFA